jgi:uncharacterized protein YoxC
MAVVRIRPGDQACRICAARSTETHESIHDCLAAIDREMQTLLKKTKSLTAQRGRLIAKEIADIQKKAREIDQRTKRARARTRPRSA